MHSEHRYMVSPSARNSTTLNMQQEGTVSEGRIKHDANKAESVERREALSSNTRLAGAIGSSQHATTGRPAVVTLAVLLVQMFDTLVPTSIAGICEGLVAIVAGVHSGLGVGSDVARQVAATGALLGTQAAAEDVAVLRDLHHHLPTDSRQQRGTSFPRLWRAD